MDIPYLYYYEWLARENFVSNLKLKNSIKIPVSQKQNIYSIHIRYLDKKKTHLSETSVKKENYYDLIFNIIKKIRNEDKKSSIIFYGIEPNSTKIIDKLLNLDCIHLEQYSSNPLERALLLSCNNISIASVNGFTDFSNFLSFSQKKLKRKIIYISAKNVDDILHSRRHLEKGISEKKLSFNSYFYGKFEFFIKDQILFKTNFKKNTNTLLNKSSKSKFIIAYNAKEIGQFYLNQHYDEVLIEHFLAEFCYEIRLRKIVIYNNKSFFDFKSKKRIFLSKSDLLKKLY